MLMPVQGETGVHNVLSLLKFEFEQAMQLAGVTSLDQIRPSFIRHENAFRSKL
jgi:isopentenyl diphosphate isomerase/L-lactate dehydrogenase-like FMN-dependent dehydrogenase